MRDHQDRVVQRLLDPRKNLIFVAGTGSGKTISAIVAGMCALNKKIVHGVVIVTPVGVHAQFKNEVARLVPASHRGAFELKTHAQYFLSNDFDSLRGKLLVVDEAHNLSTTITQKKQRIVHGVVELARVIHDDAFVSSPTTTTSPRSRDNSSSDAQPSWHTVDTFGDAERSSLARMLRAKFGLKHYQKVGIVDVREGRTPYHIRVSYKLNAFTNRQLQHIRSVVDNHRQTASPHRRFVVSPTTTARTDTSRLTEMTESQVEMDPPTVDDGVPVVFSGKTAYGATEAARRAAKVLLLTATPMKNDPVDMFNLVCMVQQAPWKEFYQTHAKCKKELQTLLRDKLSGFLTTGDETVLRKYDALPRRKCDHYLRIARESVQFANATLEGFPEKRVKDVRLVMDRKYLKVYEQAEREVVQSEFRHLFDDGGDDDILFNPEMKNVFFTKIRRAVNGITENHTSDKIKYVVNLVVDHPTERILIYSNFKDGGLSLIEKLLTQLNIATVRIDGGVSASKRKKFVDQLNDPTNPVRILLISAAGGEGLDLKWVRHVVVLEPHWHEVRIQQVIGRAIRYRSHDELRVGALTYVLPENQRNVTVHMLRLSKPAGHQSDMESADDMLHTMAERKGVFIQWYLGGLNSTAATPAHTAVPHTAVPMPTMQVDDDVIDLT